LCRESGFDGEVVNGGVRHFVLVHGSAHETVARRSAAEATDRRSYPPHRVELMTHRAGGNRNTPPASHPLIGSIAFSSIWFRRCAPAVADNCGGRASSIPGRVRRSHPIFHELLNYRGDDIA
jgi:hypothetical protein